MKSSKKVKDVQPVFFIARILGQAVLSVEIKLKLKKKSINL